MLRGAHGARGCLVLMQRVELEGSWDKTPTAHLSQGERKHHLFTPLLSASLASCSLYKCPATVPLDGTISI